MLDEAGGRGSELVVERPIWVSSALQVFEPLEHFTRTEHLDRDDVVVLVEVDEADVLDPHRPGDGVDR